MSSFEDLCVKVVELRSGSPAKVSFDVINVGGGLGITTTIPTIALLQILKPISGCLASI